MPQTRKRQFLSLSQLATGILLIIAGLLLSQVDTVHILGLKTLDWQRQLIGHVSGNQQTIILVEVDQLSLDSMQEEQGLAWPWPREIWGGISAFATSHGARATLIDILFNNESPYGIASDQNFAEQLTQAGNVFLAAAPSAHAISTQNFSLPGFIGEVPDNIRRNRLSAPTQVIRKATAGIGSVHAVPDPDGTIRRIYPALVIGDQAIPSLALAPFISSDQLLSWQAGELSVSGKVLPLDRDGRLWINFSTEPNYLRLNAYNLIQAVIAWENGQPLPNGFDPGIFSNAYVIIGYTARGLYDLKPTPFDARAPGMELHAALLDNWLADEFLRPMANWESTLIGILFGLLTLFMMWGQKSIIHSVLFSALLLILNFSLSLSLIANAWLPVISMQILPSLLTLMGAGSHRLISEGREKEFRQKSLEQMISPVVAQWLLSDPEHRLQRTGEMRPITVFFSDLVGFTPLAENLGPGMTVKVINQYMDLMQSVIFKHEGTIKQFVGDAVMAIWGAPKSQPEQCELAIATALEAQQRLKASAFEYAEQAKLRLQMRIGIDHGDCIVGNIGSSQRFEYAAVGDTVNRASRLEGLNKFYGSEIIVSDNAWQASNGRFFGRRLDQVLVKGKKQAVVIYQPMALLGSETVAQRKIADYYERAWTLYAHTSWDEAEAVLNELLQSVNDAPSQALLDRILAIRSDPTQYIGPNWNGIWQFHSK